MSLTSRPAPEDLPAFYHGYVQQTSGADIIDAMRSALNRVHAAVSGMGEEAGAFRYAPGKWSVKEVLQHVIDCERIFAYRALRFARKDHIELPGFEENEYAPASMADRRSLHDLVHELELVRSTSIVLFQSFPDEGLDQKGIANGKPITVRAIGWVIAGHCDHHTRIITERYRTKA